MTERCPECGWVFGDEEKLREHRLTHHGIDLAEELPPSPGEDAPDETGRPSRALLIGGYAGAVLLPFAGLVIAVVLLVQRHIRHGLAILLISLVVGALALTVR